MFWLKPLKPPPVQSPLEKKKTLKPKPKQPPQIFF